MGPKELPRCRRSITLLLAALALVVYAIGYRVTGIDPGKLIRSLPKGERIMSQLLEPDLLTRRVRHVTVAIGFPVPCTLAPARSDGRSQRHGPRLLPSVPCAAAGDSVTLTGDGLPARARVRLQWILPDGNALFARLARTDVHGRFTARIQVRPAVTARGGVTSRLEADASLPVGAPIPSQSLKDVVDNIVVTIFMALLATTAGTLLATPISFLAARNVTRHGWLGTATYSAVRTWLNITRSYDSLVLATVFALWVGFGAFAGVLALSVVTVASLGKLFSEAVEGIDPGPLEALYATGASHAEVVLFAVVPQVVPDFVSFIIYHWDINVRISTILGFVGGGGIGYYLSQRINVLEYRKAGTAVLAIVVVVWAMDFLSAEVRKRFT